MIKHFQQIDFSTLSFEKVQVSSSESVILPRVDSKDCPFLQLPWVELAYYGIPKASKYFPTDKGRTFIQIPIHGELLQKFKEQTLTLALTNSKPKLPVNHKGLPSYTFAFINQL